MQIEFRINVERGLGKHFDFRASNRAHQRAGLTVEIGEIEGIEVRDVESANAETRERQQVDAADAAQSSDGHALELQRALFSRSNPTNVA